MSFNMPKEVEILENVYRIEVKKIDDDWKLKSGSNAYTDCYAKKIIIGDLNDEKNYPFAFRNDDTREARYIHTLKHEITHAFFWECGLGLSSNTEPTNWHQNESLVDFITIQGDKLHKIWEKLNLID